MAPHRSVGAPRRPDQAHRLPRDHQAGDSGSHRETAHGQYGPGKRPAGAPHTRPAGRFRALARAVEKGASVALGRTRAGGGREADRRARARDHRFPLGRLFPRRGAVPRRRRPRKDALQGRTRIAFRNRGAGRGVFEKLHRRDLHGGEVRRETRPALPRTAVHHLDAPAGGRAQTGHVRIADDVRGAAPLRAGSYRWPSARRRSRSSSARNTPAGSTTRPRPKAPRRLTRPSARRISSGSRSRARPPRRSSTT